MRRVRSQLNNLAAAPPSTGAVPEVQRPLGYTHHTDEIQRRIEAMGVLPEHNAQNSSMEQLYASAMHQGNVMPNQPSYPMHNNGYPNQPSPPHQQNYALAQPVHAVPPMQPDMRQQSSLEMGNIKASLERLTHKLQGLTQNQSGQTVQNSHLQQATSRINEQYQNISAEMKQINQLISGLTESQANNKSEELADLKSMLEQQQEMFKTHMASTQENLIDPNAYATAVEVSHAGITTQVEELRSMLDSAFSNLDKPSNSNMEAAVNQTIQAQTDLMARVDQFEVNLKGDLTTNQNGIIDQINAMQKSIEAFEAKPVEQYELDTSSLDSHLEEINRAIVALSSADKGMNNLERIEARISELSKILDETNKAPVEQASPIDTDAIFSKFDSVNSAIAELGSNLNTQQPGNDDTIDGLATQINKLSEKLDNISALQPTGEGDTGTGDNSALLERLDQLVDRVETIEVPSLDVSIFSSIQDQIGDMSSLIQKLSGSDVGGGQSAEEADAVMEQLKYISSTVYEISLAQENGDDAAGDPNVMNELGTQITTLSEQITNFAGTGLSEATLSPISDRLTGIEQQLGASRDIAIEVATQAAQEAVENTVSQMQSGGTSTSFDMTPIQQLSEQVQYLKEASDSMSTSNIDTIDTVKDIFSMMAERLSNIESQVMQTAGAQVQPSYVAAAAEPAATFSQPQQEEKKALESQEPIAQESSTEDHYTEEAWRHSGEASFAHEIAAPEISAHEPDAPAMDTHAAESVPEIKATQVGAPEENVVPEESDMPIEPGTGGPDLAMLVRQAKERRSGNHPEMQRSSAGGNQFRQIAKDAMRISESEEDSNAKMKADESGGKTRFARFYDSNKKAIIIGGAALLLVALSIPLATKLLSGNTQTAAVVEEVQPAVNDDTLIKSPEELSALQSANSSEPVEENVNLLSEPVLSDSTQPDVSVTNPEVAAKETPGTETSAESTLFATEATSNAAGFGVEAEPVSVEITAEPLPDIPFGNDAFKAAIAGEDPKAIFEVGRRYTEGAGTEKNLEEAAKWYERAAGSGFAPAQYIIGNFNEKGIGLERDPQKAATWYEAAANNGNVIAMHNLAVLYATPAALSEQPDMASAFEWFKKAASYGVRDSQVNAGIFHTNGAANGKTDLVEAYKWFAVAGQAGDKDALSKRDVIGNAMRPDQLEQAKQLAKDWKPADIDRDANEVKIPDAWKDAAPVVAAVPTTIDKSTVKLVQATLSKLGFDAGPADGVMGRKTRDAITAFQKKIGIPQSGEIDPQLVQVLKQVST